MASHDGSDIVKIEDFACPEFYLECQTGAGGIKPQIAERHSKFPGLVCSPVNIAATYMWSVLSAQKGSLVQIIVIWYMTGSW
jgi:hypothetical protein